MHAKSSLLVAPSSTVWSICSQLFAERTILQGLIDNFHLDLSWWLKFFQSPRCTPIPSHLRLLALLDTGLPGSQGDSLHYRRPYPLPTKNSFWLFRQLPCGVTSGLQSGWNSVLTIQQWSRCCGPVHHEIRTWRCCYVTSPCWRPGTPLHLLLVKFLENQMP